MDSVDEQASIQAALGLLVGEPEASRSNVAIFSMFSTLESSRSESRSRFEQSNAQSTQNELVLRCVHTHFVGAVALLASLILFCIARLFLCVCCSCSLLPPRLLSSTIFPSTGTFYCVPDNTSTASFFRRFPLTSPHNTTHLSSALPRPRFLCRRVE